MGGMPRLFFLIDLWKKGSDYVLYVVNFMENFR